MADRLTALDQSYLYLEQSPVVLHMGSLMMFDAPQGGLDHEALLRHISTRIALAPRYRQRLRGVPWHLGTHVWVDDENFDLTYHVRRSALPAPGSMDQLADLVARIQPRPLDRRRPLWEVYVVEGLADNRLAVITKTHLVLVDGVHAVDISHLLLDDTPAPTRAPADTWHPAREPSTVELITGAVFDTLRRPPLVLDAARAGLGDVRATANNLLTGLGDLVWAAGSFSSTSPFDVEVSEHRRYAVVDTELDTYRAVRDFHAGDGRAALPITTNDVVMATLAGAFRTWLLARGEAVTPATTVRVMAPHSVHASELADVATPGGRATRPAGPATELVAVLVDLPVGEPNPSLRLQQVAYQLRPHAEGGRAVPASRLADVASYSPGTMHSMASRLASQLSRRMFNVVVTNVPGPRDSRYLCGGELVASYPVVPLGPFQALSVGMTSYRGQLHYGLNADRDAVPDLDVLAQCITESLAELLATVR